MAYRIYYADGTVHDSTEDQGSPPGRGVIVIVQTHPDVGWHTQCKYDFYIWRDGRWVGVDEAGLFADLEDNGLAKFSVGIYHQVYYGDEWTEVNSFGIYKFVEETGYGVLGHTLTQQGFYEIMRWAVEWMGNQKLGWLPDEFRVPEAD